MRAVGFVEADNFAVKAVGFVEADNFASEAVDWIGADNFASEAVPDYFEADSDCLDCVSFEADRSDASTAECFEVENLVEADSSAADYYFVATDFDWID